MAALPAACAFALCAGTAAAQDDAVTRANRMAYELAMKCYVANGVARGDNLDAGNAAYAKIFEADARKAFDIAVKLGNALGYSGSRQNQDFGMAEAQELARFVKDKAYLKQTLATCKAAGAT
ncbi:MAG: hypothetical protein WDN01_16880 [Rhizomicrobium sp.]